jgi:F0F1-type ATP synthase membrane subunit a
LQSLQVPRRGSIGIAGWIGGVLALALTVALMAPTLLASFLQVYVLTILARIYFNDAIHPGHESEFYQTKLS